VRSIAVVFSGKPASGSCPASVPAHYFHSEHSPMSCARNTSINRSYCARCSCIELSFSDRTRMRHPGYV
jgi:hypothetical protein